MFHFLGFLFIIIIAVLLIGLSIIGSVVQSIFKLGRPRSGTRQYAGGYSYNNQQQSHTASQEGAIHPEGGELHPKRKKLFAEDEGEYVEFEEVKE